MNSPGNGAVARLRAPTRLAALLLVAGCTSVPGPVAIGPAADWSQRIDGAAPAWPQDDALRAQLQQRRARLLAAPLTEDGALQLALDGSPALHALLAEGWMAQAQAAQGGAPPNPFVLFERVSLGGEVDITRKLGIGLTELLTWPWRRDAAEQQVQALQLQLARELLAHNAAVRSAWVRAVAARQRLGYERQVHEAAAAGAELARRMQAVGNFSRLQRAREQAFAAEAAAQLVRADTAAAAEHEALVRLLGLGDDEAAALQLPERLPELPRAPRGADGVAQRAMDERLDLLLARRQLGAAQRALGLETVSLFGVELAAVREQAPSGERGRGVEIVLALPLFDPGLARRQAAQAGLAAAEQRFAQARIDATSALRERYAAYRGAWEVAARLRDEIVPLRRTIADESLLRYNGMLIGVFELLAEARAQVGAVIDALDAERDFWLADAALRSAIAGVPAAGGSAPAPLPAGGARPAAAKGH
jgi:outer membrane protein TolC